MRTWLLLLLGFVIPTAFSADADMEALIERLAPIKQLQGSFAQRQYSQDAELLMESSGRFSLLRPGYFSWEIQSPDNQLIIADPNYLWHHDLDLETVTRRPVTNESESTPFGILGGDADALRARFNVEMLTSDTFLLTPLEPGAGFKQLSLSLENGQLTGMEITDNLDQSVVIGFADLDSESELSKADFAFTPPVDADLFYYEQ